MENQQYKVRGSSQQLDEALSEVEREIVRAAAALSLLSGEQIRRLFFHGSGSLRNDQQRARRTLLRLSRHGMLARLERRIGGVRRGSEGFVYRLGLNGQRLMQWWTDGLDSRVRILPEPGERFVAHRLAASGLYVELAETVAADDTGRLEILEFKAEPDCWRPYVGPGGVQMMLKPDAFVRLGIGDYERQLFCEIDLGTVGRRTRATQADAYRQYWRCGAAGEHMPGILWLTRNELVQHHAREATRPWLEPHGLFQFGTLQDAATLATRPVAEESR